MIRVLLVEDNPIDTRLLNDDFLKFGYEEFALTSVERLDDALRILRETPFDVVLLDLFLPDSAGLDTLFKVSEAVPDVPVVVLTRLDDEVQALQALKRGAEDYIVKGTVGSRGLFRAIRYAVERKQAFRHRSLCEQRLLEAHKLEAIGTLAGGVAHNFNNTLMVILGHSNLLIELLEGDEKKQRHLAAIKKGAERSAILIRQLLMFSRKEQPAMMSTTLNKTILDMQALLESTLGTEVQLQLNLAPTAGFVKANRNLIQQVIMSLVLNARDAMPDGGVLTIETSQDGRLILRDTGCGMTPEVCEHIFEPFFTTKGLAQASGLGLSMAYGIVQQHNGTIEVASSPGGGTAFSISFPVWAVDETMEPLTAGAV